MLRLLFVCTAVVFYACAPEPRQAIVSGPAKDIVAEKAVYAIPDTSELDNDAWGSLVKYGRYLVQNTAYYIGPNGTVSKNLGNKMNCTNCHLESGTKPYGFNFFDSHRTYPQYRARENAILTMSQRVNNCIERPHNGKPLPLDSREMNAIVSYIKWLGENYNPELHEGYGQKKIEYKGLSADPHRGQAVYIKHCQSCHMADGQGQWNAEKTTYINPPLWGPKSYQEGSSMHRVLKAAAFIKYNMPNKLATIEKPVLTDQEALDVAAFINDGRIHPRPKPNAILYANIATKPVDFFKGPYLDGFSEEQHAFGPWDEIEAFYKKQNSAKP